MTATTQKRNAHRGVTPSASVDVAILQALHHNANLSIRDLATDLKISKSTLHDRIQKLEQQGKIKGYYAKVEPAAINESFCSFVQLRTNNTLTFTTKELAFIKEIHHTDGNFDMLLKIKCENSAVFSELLQTLKKKQAILHLSSTFVLSTERENP